MKLRKCNYCGNEFENHVGGQRYCNARCSDAHIAKRIAETKVRDAAESVRLAKEKAQLRKAQ